MQTPEGFTLDNPDHALPDGFVVDQQASSAPTPGILDRLGSDFTKRMGMYDQINQATDSGQQSQASGDLQNIGKVGFGVANDVVGEGLKSIGQGISAATPDEIKQPIKDAASAIMNSSIGKLGLQALQSGEQGWNSFKQSYPVAGRNIEAVANAAPWLIPVGGTNGLEAATDAGGAALRTGADAVKSIIPEAVPSSAETFPEAAKAYQAVDAAQATYKPSGVNKFIAQANESASQNGIVNQVFGNDEVSQILNGNGTSRLGINGLADQPMTLQDAHALDKKLTEAANNHFSQSLDEQGRRILNIQDALREHLQNPLPEDVNGGAAGFQAWQQANKLYSTSKRMEDVENILRNAKLTKNPTTAIQTGFGSLLKNAKRMRGYTPDQISAIQRAAKTGIVTDLLQTTGSRLGPIIAGPIGAAAGYAASGPLGAATGSAISGGLSFLATKGLRAAAEAIQTGKGNDVLRLLGKDAKYIPAEAEAAPLMLTNQRPNTVQARYADNLAKSARAQGPVIQGEAPVPQLSLPSPQSPSGELSVNSAGQSAPMSNAEQMQANLARQQLESLGLNQNTQRAILIDHLRKMTTADAIEYLKSLRKKP